MSRKQRTEKKEQGTMRSEKKPLFFCVEKNCEWLYKKKESKRTFGSAQFAKCRTLLIPNSASCGEPQILLLLALYFK